MTPERTSVTAAEVARSHDITVGEIDQWIEDFTSMGTEVSTSLIARQIENRVKGFRGPSQTL
jgi:hypothetical protein